MSAHIDHDRVELVLDTLLRQKRANQFPYNLTAAALPQNPRNLPAKLKEDPARHATWLFCLCYYMRGGIKSVTAAQQLARLYVRRPDLFEAESAATLREGSIKRSLDGVQLRFLRNTVPHYWIENAQRLLDWHGGDVRSIFEGVDSYAEACDRIRNRSRRKPKSDDYSYRQGFCGFQDKMVSMLTYFLIDAKLIEPFPFAVPVDFHVLRVSVATEMVQFDEVDPSGDVFSESLRGLLRHTFLDYAIRNNVSAVELSDVLWLLSSTICSRNPGNITLGGHLYAARSTVLTPHQPTWSNPERNAFAASCYRCPVANQCCWDVPNANYTRKGQLLRLRPRSVPSSGINL